MKFAVAVLFCIAGALAAPAEKKDNNWRIIGGETADEGQFPYQVSLKYYFDHFCGGSILDETTIISSASCLIGYSPDSLQIVVGSNQLNQPNIVYHDIESFVYHEDFDQNLLSNDISIIKLFTPLEFNDKVQPVPLPTSNIGDSDEVILSGWGRIEYPGSIPNDLQFIHLQTLDLETCGSFQHILQVSEKQVCTFTRTGEGACDGDGGGPLVDVDGNLVGISSWAIPCAIGYPDVFTRVYSYLDWIEDNRN